MDTRHFVFRGVCRVSKSSKLGLISETSPFFGVDRRVRLALEPISSVPAGLPAACSFSGVRSGWRGCAVVSVYGYCQTRGDNCASVCYCPRCFVSCPFWSKSFPSKLLFYYLPYVLPVGPTGWDRLRTLAQQSYRQSRNVLVVLERVPIAL